MAFESKSRRAAFPFTTRWGLARGRFTRTRRGDSGTRGVRIFTWRARIPWRRRRRVRRRGRRRRRGRGGTRRRHPRMGSFRTWPPDARCTSWPPRLSTRARASARGTPRDHSRDGEVPIREKEQVPARLGESRTRERDPRSTLIRTLARAPSSGARARHPRGRHDHRARRCGADVDELAKKKVRRAPRRRIGWREYFLSSRLGEESPTTMLCYAPARAPVARRARSRPTLGASFSLLRRTDGR